MADVDPEVGRAAAGMPGKPVSPAAVTRFSAASAGAGSARCTARLWTASTATPTASGGTVRWRVTARLGRHLLGGCGQPADLDQLEAQRLDAVQQAVERGLVSNRAVQDRLHRLDGGREALERGQRRVAQAALDPDLVGTTAMGHDQFPPYR